ncbi:receptor like protein kinase S.2 [Rosa chinensis]|nr:receptor like protein kinase S.2 [Rosa chinensis]
MSTTGTTTMQLNHLCFILPPDCDEVEPPDHENQQKPTKEVLEVRKNHTRRECLSHVRAFVKESLCRLYDLKWISLCHHGTRKNRDQHHSGVFQDMDGIQLKDKVGGDNPRIFSFSELYIGSNGFSEDQVLGSGGFGKVYRAVLPSDGTVVAVKSLVERGERFEKTFVAELVAVAHLRHRNLVRLRGWCVHEKELFLVYDYMPNLSLDRILFRKPENIGSPTSVPLNWERRRNIIGGLAAALYYLHEQLETQIIHRDVKTSNVMLDSHFNARLGDFGLARWLEHEIEYEIKTPSMQNHQFRVAETTKIGGTIGYLPPESFQKRSVATAKSDVFSFGIVVLEVVSGRRAVDLTCPDDQIILLDWIRKLSDEGKLLKARDKRIPDGSYQLLDMEYQLHLALLCTLQNPQSRPNMKWVVEALSGNIHGKLPSLPSFQCHPLYISLSSASNTSTNTRYTIATSTETLASSILSTYVTATGETIYATADNGSSDVSTCESFRHKKPTFPLVETPREISYMEIVSATNNFADSQRVAELDFGTAYQGFLNNRHHVLVKRLGMKTCPALRARFSNELKNLGRLRHRNLVQLRGWCTEQGEMLVVYDYLADRLLSHLLFREDYRFGHSILQWRHRYNIIKSLASAILYLHEEWDEQVIHRNITSSAVILDPDMNPRLSSFALAEFLTRNDHGHHAVTDTSKSARGIFGYMSPECMESGEATTVTDIYSFGVVILEVITGQMAVDFRRPEVLLVKRVREFGARKKTLEDMADFRLNGVYNQKELLRLFKLGIACTRSNPQLRPSMRQLVRILDGNDKCLTEICKKDESGEEWRQVNDSALSLIKRIQALGIQ